MRFWFGRISSGFAGGSSGRRFIIAGVDAAEQAWLGLAELRSAPGRKRGTLSVNGAGSGGDAVTDSERAAGFDFRGKPEWDDRLGDRHRRPDRRFRRVPACDCHHHSLGSGGTFLPRGFKLTDVAGRDPQGRKGEGRHDKEREDADRQAAGQCGDLARPIGSQG